MKFTKHSFRAALITPGVLEVIELVAAVASDADEELIASERRLALVDPVGGIVEAVEGVVLEGAGAGAAASIVNVPLTSITYSVPGFSCTEPVVGVPFDMSTFSVSTNLVGRRVAGRTG